DLPGRPRVALAVLFDDGRLHHYLDAEGSTQVPPERRRGVVTTLLLSRSLTLQNREHWTGRRALMALPPIRQDRAEHYRDLEQLGSSGDRKSTRLNSSHVKISYAVF